MKKLLFFLAAILVAASCCNKGNVMLIPIQESAPEIVLTIEQGEETLYVADIRLADDAIDYYVPLDLDQFGATKADVNFSGVDADVAWGKISMAKEFTPQLEEKYRPVYHHTPEYGWMNDANGLFYKDGVYHLYYQYNPFAAVWGNMHWGHSTSTDLMHWEHQPVALYRDAYGHIFSGSSVIDYDNTAGFGEGAIVSFYTSYNTEREYIQTECLAYSLDDGQTFTKYENNPVLVPFDGIKDFRDPKVFWYEPEEEWIMIVSADKEMRFYASKNLKEWEFLSGWGDGYGVQPRQFECPDFFQLTTADGDTKWVMIVNVNPGCYFGGSATQYFVGEFDGVTFTCDSPKETVKWLDWGKDHYATVCFYNTGDRVIAMPWMSNWQYGAIVPNKYYRSANALPRVLGLFKDGNEYYVSVNPVDELSNLRKETKEVEAFSVAGESEPIAIMENSDGAFELNASFEIPASANAKAGLKILNDEGEFVDIYFDGSLGRFVMDRVSSGITEFGERSTTHEIENHDRRKTNSMHYVNDFALATWAPVKVEGSHTIQIVADNTSFEIFVDGGKVAMTNLVFPTEPYNKVVFYSLDGEMPVSGLTITKLGL